MNEMVHRMTAIADRVREIPLARADRIAGLAVAVPSLAVLGIARWLDPSPAGYGTHMQLGLGGCTMLTLTGWPCPMCGMTTTFSLMAEGRLLEAAANQPFGVVLFSVTAVAAVLGLVDLVGARGALRSALSLLQRWEQRIAIGLLLGLTAGWVYKCTLLHPEFFGL